MMGSELRRAWQGRLWPRCTGKEKSRWRDAQPGKILHELGVGEVARLGEIPHTPYYGTIDATPLFLILIGRHAAWTGQLTLFVEVLLGLTPEAYERRVCIIRPILPDFIDRLEVHRLRVGSGCADLSFERISEGVAVKVLKVEGPLDVIIEPEASRDAASEAGRI